MHQHSSADTSGSESEAIMKDTQSPRHRRRSNAPWTSPVFAVVAVIGVGVWLGSARVNGRTRSADARLSGKGWNPTVGNRSAQPLPNRRRAGQCRRAASVDDNQSTIPSGHRESFHSARSRRVPESRRPVGISGFCETRGRAYNLGTSPDAPHRIHMRFRRTLGR